ncbi:MAG: cyclic nucleotide-binding domain-containing protein, partial [Chromatiales bacterium]|nr:cyclic nucleotide-binding domain-containing protein [Chromatiales bacterium]
NCAYIIVTGACQVYTEQGEPGVLAELGPGQVFGEMAVLSGGRRTSSVRALTDVELQVVTREALHDALGMQTWVGPFVTALADRFKIVSRELRELKR